MVLVVLVLALWIAPAYLVAQYASDVRGHNFTMFLLLGLVTSFVFPLVLALVPRPGPSGGIALSVAKLPPSSEGLAASRPEGIAAMHHELDMLERLSDLHDRGILSDEEYVDQKNRLLAGIRY